MRSAAYRMRTCAIPCVCLAALVLMGGCAENQTATEVPIREFDALFRLRTEVALHTEPDDPIGHVTDVVVWGGRIAIVDYLQANVKVFSQSGDLLMTLGRPGDGPGEFRVPLYAQRAPDGDLAVMDARAMLISRFDSTGAYLGRWPIEGYFPGGFAVSNGSDTLIVSARSFAASETEEPLPLHVYDWAGQRSRSFGRVPAIEEPYEDMFNTVFVAALGRWVATVTYATNKITLYHLDGKEPRTIAAGDGVYRPPAWPERNLSADSLRKWRTNQVWTNKLIPMGDTLILVRFADGVDHPHGYALLHPDNGNLLSLRAGGRAIDAVVDGVAYGVQIDSIGQGRLFIYDIHSPGQSQRILTGP